MKKMREVLPKLLWIAVFCCFVLYSTLLLSDGEPDLARRLEVPSLGSLLGRDGLGRDFLKRVCKAVGVHTAILGTAWIFSSALGALAGVVMGVKPDAWFCKLALRATDVVVLMPIGLLIGAISATKHESWLGAILAVGLYGVSVGVGVATEVCRDLMSERRANFVRSMGIGGFDLVCLVMVPVGVDRIARALAGRVSEIYSVGVLISFLGIGPAPPTPTVGSVVMEALQHIVFRPAMLLGVMGITVLAVIGMRGLFLPSSLGNSRCEQL